MKKNLLKAEEMSGESYGDSYGEYSRRYSARGRGSNARRDSRGRYADGGNYSRGNMVEAMRDMMDDAPDESTRMEMQRFIDKIDRR